MPDTHCPEHERLIDDIATIRANTAATLRLVTDIRDETRSTNGRVRANEIAIATLKGYAMGAGAITGLAASIVLRLIWK
jgi:enoyl-CoA hydratase/carnithine racemase